MYYKCAPNEVGPEIYGVGWDVRPYVRISFPEQISETHVFHR